MSDACIGTPISWLRLERFDLDELSEEDARVVREHLAACPACAASLAKIRGDAAPLAKIKGDAAPAPALPSRIVADREKRADPSAKPLLSTPPVRLLTLRRAGLVATAFAMAAGLALFIGNRPGANDGNRIKGGEVSFVLVREDETVIAEAGASFRDGDRFKMVVTCPPSSHLALDAVVWDSAGASFPLTVPPGFQCGNGVALPGAFRVTGTDTMTVCLVTRETGAIDRDALRRAGPPLIGNGASSAMLRDVPCKTLTPQR